ncbi:hypothetical protein FRB99_004278 [Tulasnella sp. 403]|nr:hypothetical protein FRB99_004278 [Tulasnella sp. 403]
MAPNHTAVDKVTLTFLVDNTIEWMTKLPPGFTHEMREHISSDYVQIDDLTGVPLLGLDNYCCGAHGLSVLITTHKADGTTHQVLFDTGPEPRSISRNLDAFHLSLHELETIVLSHWHRDHSGGILEAVNRAQTAKKAHSSAEGAASKPVVVDLHPSRPIARGFAPPPTFSKVVVRLDEDPKFSEIESLGGVVSLNREPHTIADGTVFVIGGLHLAPPETQDRISPTVKFLSESLRPAPTYVLPMHCSGFNAKVALEAALGEGCVPAGVGMRVVVQGDPDTEPRLFPPTIVPGE